MLLLPRTRSQGYSKSPPSILPEELCSHAVVAPTHSTAQAFRTWLRPLVYRVEAKKHHTSNAGRIVACGERTLVTAKTHDTYNALLVFKLYIHSAT